MSPSRFYGNEGQAVTWQGYEPQSFPVSPQNNDLSLPCQRVHLHSLRRVGHRAWTREVSEEPEIPGRILCSCADLHLFFFPAKRNS